MMYETPILYTERLVLKRGTLEDLQKVYEYDMTKLRNIGGEFEKVKLDPKKIEGYEIPCPNSYDFTVYLKEDGTPIGNITADREDIEYNSIELSFNVHPDYWRKGYATEAIIEIMRFLFSQGYDNIICGYSEGNIASESIGKKLGFELLKIKYDDWEKNGKKINVYVTILSKEKFNELYNFKSK